MPSNPSPAPSSADFLGPLMHGLVHGAWALITQPVFAALIITAVVCGGTRSARLAIHSRHPRDPQRLFSAAERRLIFARAGERCEFHAPLFGRCREVTDLHADHVHPHSRGGWTHVSNGQALCARHNRAKSATIPWNRSLRRLADRRAAYFPPGTDPVVVRHRVRTPAAVTAREHSIPRPDRTV